MLKQVILCKASNEPLCDVKEEQHILKDRFLSNSVSPSLKASSDQLKTALIPYMYTLCNTYIHTTMYTQYIKSQMYMVTCRPSFMS